MSLISYVVYTIVDRAKERVFVSDIVEGNHEKISLRDVFKFRRSFWFVVLLCMTFYSTVLPFIAFSSIFIQKKFAVSAGQAGFYVSFIFLITMIFTPLLGFLIDKVGKRAALRHYSASVKTEQDFRDIQTALETYKRSRRVGRGFIQNGSTWFNNWRDWLDYEEPKIEQITDEQIDIKKHNEEVLKKWGVV